MRPLFCVAALALSAMTIAQERLVVPLADRHPELGDLSTWVQHSEFHEGPVDKQARGVFPVGNGIVFGYFGLGNRAATVQALSGPGEATDTAWAPQGHFGEQSFTLHADDRALDLPHQTIARVRGANFVVTEDRNDDGLALTTLNFAVPGAGLLYRVVQVRNGSRAGLRGVELRATVASPGETPEASDEDTLRVHSPTRRSLARFRFLEDGFVVAGELVRPFGDLAPGQTAQALFEMHTIPLGDTLLWVDPTPAMAEKQVAECLQWWRQRLAGTATFRSDPPRVADLIEDWKVLLLVQRSAQNGLFAPLVNHRGCRVRDLAGPLLLCLRYNLWYDARTMLQTVARATHAYGALREELPFDGLWQPVDPGGARWNTVAIPAGDLGSLVILFHEWYWRATGDLALIREHMPLLQRCLEGQQFTAVGLQPFGGDEGHLRLLTLLGDRLDDRAMLVAHDRAAGRQTLSLEGSTSFVMANLAMGELRMALAPAAGPLPPPGPGGTTGERTRIDPEYLKRTITVAQLAEARYWQPGENRFAPALSPLGLVAHPTALADANLRLQWLGWTFASAEKNRQNLRQTVRSLWRAPDAVRVGMTPGTGFTTGATQALLLFALADLDDRARDGALAELLRMGGPAGEWGELYDAGGLPTWTREPAWPGRCQPGASGIAIDAVCFALTGVRYTTVPGWDDARQARFRPRLPPATNSIDFRDLRRDGRRLHLHADQQLAKLTPAELEQQDQMLKASMIAAADLKVADRAYPRFTYRVEMQNPPPDDQHIVCAVNVGKGTLIRYLAERLPSFGDSCDPPVDPQAWYPEVGAPTEPWRADLPAATVESYDTLLLTARPDAVGGAKCHVVDVGLPLAAERLGELLLRDGRPRCARLVFDRGIRAGGALTAKGPGFWQQPALQQILAAYAAAGGIVVDSATSDGK